MLNERMSIMKVIRFDNEGPANRGEYISSKTSIREIAMEYGHTQDTIELYDDDDVLVAIATWPQTGGAYMYCTGKNLDPNPIYRVFIH
jgi:hypothetical protein